MMTFERVTDLKAPPSVGRVYLVPTVRAEWRGRKGIFPVVGPWHEDADLIGFLAHHFHVDLRFLAGREYHRALPEDRLHLPRDLWISGAPIQGEMLSPTEQESLRDKVVWRRRFCRRVQPDISELPDHLNNRFATAFRGKRLRDGMVCPHRGHDLSACPVRDGKVTCPLHGLTFDVATGKCVTAPIEVTL